MIEHNGRNFDDSKFKPYSFSRRLARNYYEDECEIFLVYGMPEGIGKSAYVHHVLADIIGYQECHDKERLKWMWEDKTEDVVVWDSDWESTKRSVLYLPKDVVLRCKTMLIKGQREVGFHWDDGGTWLNAMEWQDPFVVAFMEYLSLARSNWGGVIISTPVDEWVLKKLHSSVGILRIPIMKLGANYKNPLRPRRATCYKIIKYPNRVRHYWKTQFTDDFTAIMPDDFYRWYKPNRDKYALMATLKMDRALAKRKKRGWDVSDDEQVLEEMKKHVSRANDEAKDFSEVVHQMAT